MYERALQFLCCPVCGSAERRSLTLTALEIRRDLREIEEEVETGLLACGDGHVFPIVRGVPRLLPDSLAQHQATIRAGLPTPVPAALAAALERAEQGRDRASYHRQTQENFSFEWQNHDIGGRTWGMQLEDRVNWYFLRPLGLPLAELAGKVVLDAGCGNGSQSVAYTAFGLEVLAVDLSTGLELGHAYRRRHPEADATRVHFIQADLQRPPIMPATVDIVHSAGVLHHTPDTRTTFRALVPLLRPEGLFYLWLYRPEAVVTPILTAMRAVTTRIPPELFARMANVMATSFVGFCAITNALKIRAYPSMRRREASLALMDIFGAPHAHSHNVAEVEEWFRSEGFTNFRQTNDNRRGFGACARSAPAVPLARERMARETLLQAR